MDKFIMYVITDRLTDVANGKRWHFDNCKKFK